MQMAYVTNLRASIVPTPAAQLVVPLASTDLRSILVYMPKAK